MAAQLDLEHAIGYSGSFINSAHLHPDGRHIIYIAGSCIVIGDLKDPHQQEFLRGHDDVITCLKVSKSGRFIASGQMGENADVVVWDFKSRKMLYRLNEHDHAVKCIDFTDDERLLLTAGDAYDRRLVIWDMSSGNIVVSTGSQGGTSYAAWGGHVLDIKRRPTADYQFATTLDDKLSVWHINPKTGDIEPFRVATGSYQRRYSCVAFAKSCEYLYAGSTSGDFTVIQLRNRLVAANYNAGNASIVSIIELSSGKLLVGCADGTVTLYGGNGKDFVDEKRINIRCKINSLSLSGDEVTALIGTLEGETYILNLGTFEKPRIISESHTSAVLGVAFMRDVNDKFTTISDDHSVRFWDSQTYLVKHKKEIRGEAIPLSTCFLNDFILTGMSDGTVRAIDSVTGELLWSLEAHRAGVSAITTSNNCKFFVTGCEEGIIRVWNVRTRELVTKDFKEHRQMITGLQVFEDDLHILSSSRDRSIFVWDLKRERRVSDFMEKIGGINDMKLSRDQVTIVSAGQAKHISFWDVRQPQAIRKIPYDQNGLFEPRCVDLSHRNDLFAVGGTDENVNIFDTKQFKLVDFGEGHSGTVNDLAFAPDDKQLVSVGNDGCTFVWSVLSR